MARATFQQRLFLGLATLLSTVFSVPAAFALSNGCATVNNLSGSTSLSYQSNRYPAADFLPGDALTLTFTDSGAGAGMPPMNTDSVSLARYDLSNGQTYNATNSTSNTSHTVSITVPTGSLEANGLAVRANTSHGQISNLVFNCTSTSQVSTDATLSGLALSAGTLSPGFSSNTTSYTASVSNATTSITVRPTATDSGSTITVNGNAVVSGSNSAPINLAVGSNSVSVVVTAADGQTTKSYSISVTRAEAVPVANNVSATVAANSSNNAITLSITGTATSVAVASAASHGTATASGTSITYTPTAGYSGSDSFTYTASNGSGTSAAATVTLTVSRPTLTVTPASGALPGGQVGTSYSQTITGSGGSAPYTYSATGLPAGLSLNTAAATISGTPTAAGSYTLSVVVTDANGATGSANYTLSIAVQPPVAGPVSLSVASNSRNNPVTLNLSGGAATSVAVASLPTHGTATASGLSITYTPAAGYAGADSFSYTATNASGTSAAATVTLSVSAVALTFTPASGALPAGQVGSGYSTSLQAAGGAAPYRYAATGLPAGVALDAASGQLSGTPTAAGTYSVSVTATDNAGNTGSASYSLTIGVAAPVAAATSATVAANSSNNVVTLALSGGAATSVAVVSAPSHGVAVASGTSIRYTPNASYAGSDSFTYSASNASGTSAAASVSITVTASALVLTPAAGALPAASVGSAYRQVFSATGGVSPYSFSAAGLPAGLSLDASSGSLSGTPTSMGSTSFSITVTDASGTRASASYSLTTSGVSPKAADTTIAVAAGQSVSLDLSAGATGGPFTSATLLDTPAQALGSARLTGTALEFTAASRASGTVALRFTLANAWGTSQPATLTLQINARTDPSRDAEVAGVLSAQTQSAQQFARAQISNFTDRLEQLHSLDGHRNAFNLRFNPTQAQARTLRNPTDVDDNQTALDPLANVQALTDNQQRVMHASSAERGSQPLPNGNLSLWTGGYVDFGSTRNSGEKVSNTTVGISSGIDVRLSNAFTLGVGIGLGNDKSDIGSSGSNSRGTSYSVAAYGSYHPNAVFLDGMLGYSRLQFDSERFVTDNGRYAKGRRNGDQLFGSLSSGYEVKGPNWLVSPYGRVDTSTTWLRGYKESNADSYNLDYAEQRFSLVSGVAGVRGQYGVPLSWAYLTLRSRLEFSHTFNSDSTARMAYVDVDDSTYSITTKGFGDNRLSTSLGVDLVWSSGLSTGIGYQGTRAIGEQSRSDALSLRAAYRF
ncbi:autotransporter domain-containing protein [uncultured Pseudomonas sp.]|uniref:autotransporter domain-containing protein n=1 Tax=uncultured Pseudomonas sp. TaxID=114707 RepID=UPI0025EF9245|nr:autotransporter domain-containing protein [uncultured Pseudomonas sp.]